MATHRIRKGLDLPITGHPIQVIRDTPRITRVAIMADDFPGMKARMEIEEGEPVKRGQVLFEDRKNPGVVHTAPGAGRVIGVHRGARRALQSVVIDLSDGERDGAPRADELATFQSYTGKPAAEFSWEGHDEDEQVFGRGWAIMEGDQLDGMIFLHHGDESGFVAERGEG